MDLLIPPTITIHPISPCIIDVRDFVSHQQLLSKKNNIEKKGKIKKKKEVDRARTQWIQVEWHVHTFIIAWSGADTA